jgi:hypothetical protein
MQRTIYTCDVCGADAAKGQFVATLDVGGKTIAKDACSAACFVVILTNVVTELSPGKVVALKTTGACYCPPSNWNMTPADSSTPGVRDVECKKCGSKWRTEVKDVAAAIPPSASPAEETRRRGRKKNGEAQPASSAPAPAPPSAEDRVVNEPPRWCGECGRPMIFKVCDPTENGGWSRKWVCDAGHQALPIAVKQGLPGEDLSGILYGLEKFGIRLNLVEVAGQWTVLQRDTVREWIKQGGKPEDRPVFLPAPASSAPKPDLNEPVFA